MKYAVNLEQSEKLRKLGFPEKYNMIYVGDDKEPKDLFAEIKSDINPKGLSYIAWVSYLELVKNWLREEKSFVVSVDVDGYNNQKMDGYFFAIYSIKDNICDFSYYKYGENESGNPILFDSYGKALSEGIDVCLKIIENEIC